MGQCDNSLADQARIFQQIPAVLIVSAGMARRTSNLRSPAVFQEGRRECVGDHIGRFETLVQDTKDLHDTFHDNQYNTAAIDSLHSELSYTRYACGKLNIPCSLKCDWRHLQIRFHHSSLRHYRQESHACIGKRLLRLVSFACRVDGIWIFGVRNM